MIILKKDKFRELVLKLLIDLLNLTQIKLIINIKIIKQNNKSSLILLKYLNLFNSNMEDSKEAEILPFIKDYLMRFEYKY